MDVCCFTVTKLVHINFSPEPFTLSYLISIYLLKPHSVPGTVLSAEDVWMNQKEKCPALTEVMIQWDRWGRCGLIKYS